MARAFMDGFFEFLFIPQQQKKRCEFEMLKEFELYNSHLSTLIYDVVSDGIQTQQIAKDFFNA